MQKKENQELEIIDLDEPTDEAAAAEPPRRKGFRINTHLILAFVVLLTIAVIFFRFSNWGVLVDPDEAAGNQEDSEYYAENLDNMLPLIDAEGNMVRPTTEDGLSIAIFGNGPFAEDRDSESGLAAMLADATGATVYNCSVRETYMAESSQSLPLDVYTPYWLSILACGLDLENFHEESILTLGTDAPPELESVYKTLKTLDFTTVDTIVFMYDASDYLAGRPVYNPDNPSDLSCAMGNLSAAIALMKQFLPNTRIIVMSPTYAFSDRLDENGNYISSDIVRYGDNPLSDYVQHMARIASEQQVTFVDNFYVTFNEDNAVDYLEDNMHLNSEGRRKVVDRLVYALNYFGGWK